MSAWGRSEDAVYDALFELDPPIDTSDHRRIVAAVMASGICEIQQEFGARIERKRWEPVKAVRWPRATELPGQGSNLRPSP